MVLFLESIQDLPALTIRPDRLSRMSKKIWAGIWIVLMAFLWEERFCQGCLSGTKLPFAMPYWMPHLYSLCQDGALEFCVTFNVSMCGHVTTGQDSGKWCFTRIIMMFFWTNVEKYGLMVKAGRYWTGTKTSIPGNWSLSEIPTFTSGTGQRNRL